MAKTAFGTFEETYHHIDAPTYEDKQRSKELGHRILKDYPGLSDSVTNQAFYYLQGHEWVATRKIDGTNIRIKWDGEQALIAGKTNNADLKSLGKDFEEFMFLHFLEERFEEKFGREKTVIIFGEWAGPKVQKNDLNLVKPEFIMFDVQIGGTWLDKTAVEDIANHFDCHTPYDFMTGRIYGSLSKLIEDVAEGLYADWEGLVAEPLGGLRDKTGKRIICKIKNRDYNPNWAEK